MSVTILYFAHLKDERKRDSEEIDFRNETIRELYQRLFVYKTEPPAHLRVAVNCEYVDWGTQLVDGDEVAFIPPVAGG